MTGTLAVAILIVVSAHGAISLASPANIVMMQVYLLVTKSSLLSCFLSSNLSPHQATASAASELTTLRKAVVPVKTHLVLVQR